MEEERGRVRNYHDLQVWQKAHALTLRVYEITKAFPQHELFGLTSQLRRSTASVPTNIVEGFSRSTREFIQFLSIAKGSLEESRYHLLLSKDLGYLDPANHQSVEQLGDEIGRMIHGLTEALKLKEITTPQRGRKKDSV